MDLAQVKAFVTVSREKSFAKAAERMNLTASPVSRTIRELERELSSTVFDREYHDLRLTDAGDRLLPHAVEILQHVGALTAAAQQKESDFRIASTSWAPDHFVDLMKTAAATSTSRRLVYSSESSAVTLWSLLHGDVDLAMVHFPVESWAISSRPIARYRFHVLMNEDDSLSSQSQLRLSDLDGKSLMSLSTTLQLASMGMLTDRLLEAGVVRITSIELGDLIALGSRIRRTGELMLGIKFNDSPAARLIRDKRIVAVPLVDDQIDFVLGLAWRSFDPLNAELIEQLVLAIAPAAGEPLEIIE